MARGRRKAVHKFTNRQGLALLGVVAAILIVLMVLWVLGYLRLDVD
jgi:hypothetical protein